MQCVHTINLSIFTSCDQSMENLHSLNPLMLSCTKVPVPVPVQLSVLTPFWQSLFKTHIITNMWTVSRSPNTYSSPFIQPRVTTRAYSNTLRGNNPLTSEFHSVAAFHLSALTSTFKKASPNCKATLLIRNITEHWKWSIYIFNNKILRLLKRITLNILSSFHTNLSN